MFALCCACSQRIATDEYVEVDVPSFHEARQGFVAAGDANPSAHLTTAANTRTATNDGATCRERATEGVCVDEERIRDSTSDSIELQRYSETQQHQFTEADLTAIAQFERHLASVPVNAVVGWRFIKVCSSVRDAAEKYRNYLAWREAERIDSISQEPDLDARLEAILQDALNLRVLDGLDFQARPVLFVRVGSLDTSVLAKQGVTFEMLLRRYIRQCERMFCVVSSSTNPMAGYLVILDLSGCTTGKFLRSWRVWIAMAKTSDTYYPELVGKLCCVNGPSASAWAINKVIKLLGYATAEKVELHDPQGSMEALSRLMPSELVPEELRKLVPADKAACPMV